MRTSTTMMKHREVLALLPEFEAGVLDSQSKAMVESHLLDCLHCQEWMETHDLLAEELGRNGDPIEDHPHSQLLALCAVRPEEVYEPGREALRDHLEHCTTCRHTVAQVGGAVRGTRPAANETRSQNTPSASPHRGLRIAAALALMLLSVAVISDLSLRLLSGTAWSRNDAPTSPVTTETVEELAGGELRGVRLIRADRRLDISHVTVVRGAEVTFRAGEVIAFGDGFRVDTGARITVGPEQLPLPPGLSESSSKSQFDKWVSR